MNDLSSPKAYISLKIGDSVSWFCWQNLRFILRSAWALMRQAQESRIDFVYFSWIIWKNNTLSYPAWQVTVYAIFRWSRRRRISLTRCWINCVKICLLSAMPTNDFHPWLGTRIASRNCRISIRWTSSSFSSFSRLSLLSLMKLQLTPRNSVPYHQLSHA